MVAVVTARPGARVVERSALASTSTSVDVEQVLQGEGARVAEVEQIGTLPPGGLEVPGQVLLEPGRRYLLFLQQVRPDDPGTYGVVGVTAGLYAADPADPGRFLAQSGADEVPRVLTPAELTGP